MFERVAVRDLLSLDVGQSLAPFLSLCHTLSQSNYHLNLTKKTSTNKLIMSVKKAINENQNHSTQIMDGNVKVPENCYVRVVLKFPWNCNCVYFVWSFI